MRQRVLMKYQDLSEGQHRHGRMVYSWARSLRDGTRIKMSSCSHATARGVIHGPCVIHFSFSLIQSLPSQFYLSSQNQPSKLLHYNTRRTFTSSNKTKQALSLRLIFSPAHFVKMLVVSMQKEKNFSPYFFLIFSQNKEKPGIEMVLYAM